LNANYADYADLRKSYFAVCLQNLISLFYAIFAKIPTNRNKSCVICVICVLALFEERQNTENTDYTEERGLQIPLTGYTEERGLQIPLTGNICENLRHLRHLRSRLIPCSHQFANKKYYYKLTQNLN
jgi:hypothetical protein